MKNRLLTMAGALALLAVVGKFYALPAIAQTIRAALVQDRDSPARQAFTYSTQLPFKTGEVLFPSVPAGKRRVINGVYVVATSVGACPTTIATSTPGGGLTFFALLPGPLINPGLGLSAASLAPAQIVMNAGDLGNASISCATPPEAAFLSLTGYDIDIP
jgi:hypothetical protein